MKKTEYFLLGLFLVGIIAVCIAMSSLPCPPLGATSNSSVDRFKPASCQSIGAVEF